MSNDDRARWETTHAGKADRLPGPPARFLAEHIDLLPPGRTLDLAAGSGRNALALAARGHRVLAVDVALGALRRLQASSSRINLAQIDLDSAAFRAGSLDNVVCVNFLDRRLFPQIAAWLRPGGALLFDTFLIDQASIGHPRSPAFLLGHDEILALLPGYRIVLHREGLVEEPGERSFRAGVVAVRQN